MRTPPLLVGAALLFWGWQTGFLLPGIAMALVLESSHLLRARWEFSDEDFNRIWTFCALLFLAAGVFAFTDNQGPAGFSSFFQEPNFITTRNAGTASARTAAALVRWLPMIFCLFVAAQAYSSRQGIPLQTISLILRLRWKRARKLGRPLPDQRTVNVSYPYFALCLFAASIHVSEDGTFFWGLCALLAWALWFHRSRRFSFAAWAAVLAGVFALGYLGQHGVGRLQHYLENFNPQWLSGASRRGFDLEKSQTALGQLGRIKTSGQIVIRLQKESGPAPSLLRQTSYRTFKGQTWYANTSDNDLQRIPSETDETTYVLLRDKTNSASANIACYLPGGSGLLPLPTGSGRLENLMAYDLQKSPLGAVVEKEGPGLVIFDAHYGPGATLDGPPSTNEDLAIPPRETEALAQVIADLHLSGRDLEHTLRTLPAFFAEKFTYSTWQGLERISTTNETALSRFLLRTRSGHCEYFATATVLLLRKAGYPARYAVGYAVHEGAQGKYVVRQRDAHAWCLVWNEARRVWQDFDTTPASWVEEEGQGASPLQALSDAWSWLRFQFSKLRWGQSHLRQYLLWALVPVLLLLLYQIVFRSRWRRHAREQSGESHARPWPGLDSEFYQLEEKLRERGLARPPGEPVSQWLERALKDPALAPAQDSLRKLLLLHYRYRFDPAGLNEQERAALRSEVRECLNLLEGVEPGALR